MKFGFFVVVSSLLVSVGAFAQNLGASVDVTLTPAGSFQAKTEKVTGTAYKTPDGGVAAENVIVALNTVTTGIELRDKHTRRYLEADKYPTAKLIKATGKDGKGVATIEIKGIQKQYNGTYKVEGNTLKASFKVHLPDVKITGVKYMGIGVAEDVTVNIALPLGAGRATASAKK